MSTEAWVMLGVDLRPYEVFGSQGMAVRSILDLAIDPHRLVYMNRSEAVGYIRHEIFVRQKGRCIACNEIFTEAQMHMHEKVSRGDGGNISLDNSEGLCYADHLGKNGAHGDRRPKFGEEGI